MRKTQGICHLVEFHALSSEAYMCVYIYIDIDYINMIVSIY